MIHKPLTWTARHAQEAAQFGWGVYETSVEGCGPWIIESVYPDVDADPWLRFAEGLRRGHVLHKYAFDFIEQKSPAEHEAIRMYLRDLEEELNETP